MVMIISYSHCTRTFCSMTTKKKITDLMTLKFYFLFFFYFYIFLPPLDCIFFLLVLSLYLEYSINLSVNVCLILIS